MRKISPWQILVFLALWLPFVGLSVATAAWLSGIVPFGAYRGVVAFLIWVVAFYAFSLVPYRLFLGLFPLQEGLLEEGSREEFVYHVYLLFNVVIFQPLMRSFVVPVPLMRVVYLALGAKLGPNTYSGGTILDPIMTRIGGNTIVGHDAVLISHFIAGRELSLSAIEIGDNVTVGAKAVIMPGVRIGDNAVIGINALVTRGTHVGVGETWVGTPARCLRTAESEPAPLAEGAPANAVGQGMPGFACQNVKGAAVGRVSP